MARWDDEDRYDREMRVVVWVVGVSVVVLLLLASMQLAFGAPSPFAVQLPDGSATIACGATYYLPPAKLIELHPCESLFASGFEP